ncbi:MAG: hypothetical protein QOE11_362 [Solirubrobacteraceae bacterium]|jgi:hypothetical protein|nr:hypothetical protein [Solirubrobacteraceae bacterium]
MAKEPKEPKEPKAPMEKKEKKGKGKDEAAVTVVAGVCVARHPRHAGAVRRAKGWGGVAGAVLCSLLASRANLPAFDWMLRGLAGGIAGYLAVWALALAVARQLVIAEVRARFAELEQTAAATVSDG